MATRSEFRKVKFFCGLIFAQNQAAAEAIDRLPALMSSVDNRSAVIPFATTEYYRAEMGRPLFRQFVSFKELLSPQRLPEIKLGAMCLEERLSVGGKRTVNLDPGYLSDANVIIATAKNQYHRVPLRDGVYAHMEYTLKDGRINFLPWTYPDYKTGEYLAFFADLYLQFKRERKER